MQGLLRQPWRGGLTACTRACSGCQSSTQTHEHRKKGFIIAILQPTASVVTCKCCAGGSKFKGRVCTTHHRETHRPGMNIDDRDCCLRGAILQVLGKRARPRTADSQLASVVGDRSCRPRSPRCAPRLRNWRELRLSSRPRSRDRSGSPRRARSRTRSRSWPCGEPPPPALEGAHR